MCTPYMTRGESQQQSPRQPAGQKGGSIVSEKYRLHGRQIAQFKELLSTSPMSKAHEVSVQAQDNQERGK
jgi:hypothetical protein